MMVLAEKRVEEALKAKDSELRAQPHKDKVSMTLMNFFAPERCPSCACAFEHAGSCAAMHCAFCKQHFFLYCKLIFKAEGSTVKKTDTSTMRHVGFLI